MLIKLLGFIDIIAAVTLILAFFSIKSNALLLIFAFYLLVKFILFSIESLAIVNFFDLFGSVVIFWSMAFPMHNVLFLIAAILILEKGIVSLK